MAYKTAGVVVVDVHGGSDLAALDEIGTVGEAHETRSVILVGGYGACCGEVADGGAVNVAEGRKALIAVVGKRGGDSLVVAVEGAAEGLVVAVAHPIARHRRHADVGHQFHELAVAGVAVVDLADKSIPFVSAADGVGVFGSACAMEARDDEDDALRAVAIAYTRDGEGLGAQRGDDDGE